MKKPLVSVVILNLNGAGFTVRCLDSIRKSAFRDYEIIVVDNGSDKKDVDVLVKRRDIRLVRNAVNLGFAEGNNVGVRASKGKYVCLLNNDTKVGRNWLRELVAAAETDKRIAICNPKFFDKYEEKDYVFRGYGTIGLFHAPVFLPQIDKGTDSYVRSLTASGSAFFRKDVIGEPFDADYFAYAEDAQLGWRATLMGYKVVHVPKSIVYHEGGATAKRMKVPKDFFFVLAERNKLLNIFTLYSGFALLRLLPYSLANVIFANVYDPGHFFSRLKVYFWLLSNFGKVMGKRARLQGLRKVPDKEIVKLMSYKLYDDAYVRNPLFRLVVSGINRFFFVYCLLVGLRTVEFRKIRSEKGLVDVV
ncbi:glycosyltransferase [Candidatus Woesearchaeota archaeon]|nr:glycosyltransferase [Candidatus Woesearchaeota archaeon]